MSFTTIEAEKAPKIQNVKSFIKHDNRPVDCGLTSS